MLACAIERCEEFQSIYRFQAATARILNRSLETLLRLRKAGPLLTPEEDVGQALSPANPPEPESYETNPIPQIRSPVPDAPTGKSRDFPPTYSATRDRINYKTGRVEPLSDHVDLPTKSRNSR